MPGIGNLFTKLFTATKQPSVRNELEIALKKAEEVAKAVAKRNLEIENICPNLDQLTADLFERAAQNQKKLSK